MKKKENSEIAIPVNSTGSFPSGSQGTDIEFVSDVIFRLDNDGRVVFISDSIKLYGYQPEELIKQNILDLVCDGDKKKTSEYLKDQLKGIKNYGSIEIGLLTKNRKRIDFKVFCAAEKNISDSKNKNSDMFMDIHGIAVDISNIKKSAEEKSYRIKFQNLIGLTRSMCHELSQPVTILLGYSEIMLSTMEENDPLYNKLNEINRQADKTDEIIRRMHRKIKYIAEESISGSEIVGKT